ncbi:MAG: cbb3-type cytochrome c oxidase subunit II [Nitrospiraceae bacterium]
MKAPDLSYVGDTRPDRGWHLRHFRDPESLSPGSIMPNFLSVSNNSMISPAIC